MSEERYEPIAPVNTNVGGDDANKFAVKYKKEIPHIYEILNVLKNLLGDDNPTLVVDEALSEESVHPVQNQAITKAFGNYYTKNDIEKIIENWSGITGGGNSGQQHTYRVTIYQQPHQVITVKKIMEAEEATHVASFMAEEKYERLEVSLEADEGYIPGELNCDAVITLNKDVVISATQPTRIAQDDVYKELYWPINSGYGSWGGEYSLLSIYPSGNDINGNKSLYLTENYPSFNPAGKYIYRVTIPEESVPYHMFRLFNVYNYPGPVMGDRLVTKLIIDLRGKRGLQYIDNVIGLSNWLEEVELRNWDTSEVESIFRLFNAEHEKLKSITGLAGFGTGSLLSIDGILSATRYFTSLDLSQWTTPKLTSAGNIFTGDWAKVLDISNWDTSHLTSFTIGASGLQYLIMDAEEIKFSGNLKCDHPNNKVKYLVPSSMVNAYKNHPNWADWADQIESIDKYTITRYDGKVAVELNE